MGERIKDKDFKCLLHTCKNYQPYRKGEELEKGYRPDIVLIKRKRHIIIELENAPSRKTLVGGMIKAAHFLTGNKKGILVFVISPKKDKKLKLVPIVKHLQTYLTFIQKVTNLKKVFVIETDKYCSDYGRCLELLSEEFITFSECIVPHVVK